MNSVNKLFVWFVVSGALLFCVGTQAAVIDVPGDHATIQAAIDAAGSGDTIVVAAGTYTENVTIAKSLRIEGAGADATCVDAQGSGIVLFVSGPTSVVLVEGLTLRQGEADFGAGLFVEDAAVTLVNCAIRDCEAALGGAVANAATYLDKITLIGCTFHGNTTGSMAQGGAINMYAGVLNMTNCTVSGNSANKGGGLFLDDEVAFAFQHITVVSNTVSGRGASGSGIYFSGIGTMDNSIVAANVGADNCYGSYTGTDNYTGSGPLVGPLADNGGPTPTHALLTGSAAIDAGASSPVTVDQRGVTRGQGNAPDIGAYEVIYTVYVDNDWTGPDDCGGRAWGLDGFATIAEAVAAVPAAGVVSVAAGTYNESLTCDKPLTLAGPAAGEKPLLVGMLASTYTGGLATLIENVNFRVNATDPNNLKLTGVKNLSVKGCDFDADGRFMDTPNAVAIQLNGACQNITVDSCTFHDGYYVTIQGSAENLLVKESSIQNCKSGINIQYSYGSGVTVENTEISVVAQGVANDTYCIRFGSASGTAQNLSITGATLTVDPNGLTPDPGTFHAALIMRAAASGTLAISESGIQGGVVNQSTTTLAADGNWWGSASGPTSSENPGGTGSIATGDIDFIPFYTEATFENLAPYALSLSAATVAENAASGTEIGTLATTDDDVGDSFTYTLVTGEGDDDNGSFALDGAVLKTAASFDFETQPTLSVRVQTSDGNGGLYQKAFTITVTDLNEAPVLESIGNREVAEDIELAFVVEATDQDNDELTYTWENVPAWATADGTSFAGTPREGQDGVYTVTVTVSDGELSDFETFTITVSAVNDPPVVAAALQDLSKQQDFASAVIDLSPVFSDIENNELAYSVEVDGVVDASVTGSELTLTSISGARGVATVTVTATETLTAEKLFVSDSFTVTVKPVWNTMQGSFFDTIQAAIDDAATVSGDTISVAAGAYTQSVTVSKPLDLVATGAAMIVGTAVDAVTVAADGVSLTGFTIQNPTGVHGIYALNRNHLVVDGNTVENIGTAVAVPGSAVCGVMIYSTSAGIDDVVIADNVIRGIESQGNKKGANGVWVGDSAGNLDITGLIIQGNTISNIVATPSTYAAGGRGAYGIIINHAITGAGRTVAPVIKDNLITDLDGVWAHAIGLEGETPDALVVGNVIARIVDHKSPADPDAVGIMVEDNPAAASVLIVSNSFSEVLIGVRNVTAIPVTADGNYWGSATPDITALVMGDVVVESFYADAALTDLRHFVVYVDKDFTEATEGWGVNRFATIQGGADAVSPYGTVHVAEGTYVENVVVGKTLALVGAGAATTTINGGNSGVVVKITANDVEMSGFTVTGSGGTPLADAGVILQGVTGCAVTECTVSGNGGVGIGLQLSNGNTVQGNILDDNVIAGIGLMGAAGNAILDNTVSATAQLAGLYGYGIVLEGVDVTSDGREDLFSTGNTVSGNTLSGNAGDGLYLGWDCNGNSITDNTATANGNDGIYLWKSSGNTVTGNTLADNVAEGMQLMASADNTITGNTISGSAIGLWIRSGWTQYEPHTAGFEALSSGNTLAQNVFSGNTQGLVLEDNAEYTLDDEGLVDASANYWGSPFGPSGTGFFGTGDSISGAVDIASYYTDAGLTTLHYFDLTVDFSYSEATPGWGVTAFATIPSAYAAANPGDTIHVADGAYALPTTLNVAKPGLTLTGASRAGVIIDASARTGTAYGILVSASDVTLEHFTLIPASYAGAGFPIHVSAAPAILSNITLRDIAISGSYRTPFDFNGVNDLVLEGLIASGATWGTGIGLSGCVGVTITGCQTAGNAWGGVRVSGSTDVEPDRASSGVNVDFAANAFAEVNALYIEDPVSSVIATGYSYKITTSVGTTTYLEQGYTEAQAIDIALQAEASFPGLTVTGLFEADGTPIAFDGDLSTAVVYVDDDWAGTSDGTGIPKPGAPAGTYLLFGHNAFATVQGGVGGVDAGGTVRVMDGLYTESNIAVGKAMTVLGQSRDGVVLVPADEDPGATSTSLTPTGSQHGFVVSADDVTISLLTLDGHGNPALTPQRANYRCGVLNALHSRMVLDRVTVLHTHYYGIYIGSQSSSGHEIVNSLVDDCRYKNLIRCLGVAKVSNNVVRNGSSGIYLAWCSATDATLEVTGNVISNITELVTDGELSFYGPLSGGLHDYPCNPLYMYFSNTDRPVVVASNVIAHCDDETVGMYLYNCKDPVGRVGVFDNHIDLSTSDDNAGVYLGGCAGLTFSGNTLLLSGRSMGVTTWRNTDAANPVVIRNNFFLSTDSVCDDDHSAQGCAIGQTDDTAGFWYASETAESSYIVVENNDIRGFVRGVYLHKRWWLPGDEKPYYGGPITQAEADVYNAWVLSSALSGNRISACAVGIDALGGVNAQMSGNALTDCENAVRAHSDHADNKQASVALSDNTFDGATDNGTDLAIGTTVGTVTIGAGNIFAGDTLFIENQSTQDFDLTANGTTFDEADHFAIEDKVFHKVDDLAKGLVRWAPGELFVTPASGSIQRGVDAAAVGDTVNVAAGTYAEQITIAKALTVTGQDGAALSGVGLGSAAVGVKIKSGDVTLANMEVGDFGGNGIIVGYEANPPGDLKNVHILHNRIHGIQPGSSHGFGIYVGYEAEGLVGGPGGDVISDLLDYAGLMIVSNEIHDTAAAGLVLQSIKSSGADLLIWRNWIHDADQSGLWIDSAQNIAVTENALTENTMAGVFLSGYADGYYEGTPDHPFDPAHIVITGNTIAGNGSQGVAIYDGGTGSIVIEANAVVENGTDGLFVYGLLVDNGAAAVPAEENWWGSLTGPTHASNPGGSGAVVSGLVDFSPWLGDGTDTDPATIGFQPNLTTRYNLPVSLAFQTAPNNTALDETLGAQVVHVIDENGGTAVQYNGTVSIALGANPGQGVLTGTLTVPVVAGVATFDDLAVTIGGGAGYTLTVISGSLTPAVSDTFDVANPPVAADTLAPFWVPVGSATFTLQVNGTGFVPTSEVAIDGTARTTTYLSAMALSVEIDSSEVAAEGDLEVSVRTQGPGASESNILLFRILSAIPAGVFVDDDYEGMADDSKVDWPYTGEGDLIVGYNAFAAVQGGVAAVLAGGTVNVAAGRYEANVVIPKAMTLLGPNAGVNPNTGERSAEAVIVPESSSPYGEVVMVQASDVTIDGFVFDADNPNLESGFLTVAGADLDAAEAVTVYADNVNRLIVQNNVIENFGYFGVTLFGGSYSCPSTTGHVISDNVFRNLGTYDEASGIAYWGAGVLLYNDQYAAVVDNVMTNVRIGVQTGNFHDPNPGDAQFASVSRNLIHTRGRGIFHNLHTGNAAPFLFEGNDIHAMADTRETKWIGILVGSMGTDSKFVDNSIDGTDAEVLSRGYEIWNAQDCGLLVDGGTVSGVDYGVWANNYEGYSSDASDGAHVVVSNTIVTASTYGVYVLDSTNSTTHANVEVGLSGVSVNGGAVGLMVSGTNAVVIAMDDVALSGQTGSYIVMDREAMKGLVLDATAATFDGETGAMMDLDELFAVEDKIVHAVDDATLGLVRVKADELFVTTSSGSIQRGIDAASAGDTVNVAAGSYVENLAIAKPLTLAGVNRDLVTVMPALSAPMPGGAGSLPVGSSNVILVQADDVTIQGLTVDGDNPALTSGVMYGGADLDARNGIVTDHRVGSFTGMDVHDVRVRNIYLRGIYASTGGAFAICNNEVSNVGGDIGSMAIMNWAGAGVIASNLVQNCADGIVANHSSGTLFLDNRISGVFGTALHTDNNGSMGGVADALRGNVVSDCPAGGWGLMVFAPRLATVVEGNVVSNAAVGICVAGYSTSVTPIVRDNEFHAESLPGSYGAYVTCSLFGWGSADVSANFANNIFGTTTGIYVEAVDGHVADLLATQNAFGACTDGIVIDDAGGSVAVDAPLNWWGSLRGPTCAANAGGDGSAVSEGVGFSPWLGDGTDTSAELGFQPDLALVYATPDHLIFATQPGGAALRLPLDPKPVVHVIDDLGRVATQYVGTVTLALASNPGGGELSGTLTVPVVEGVATFSDVVVTVGGGTGYALLATTSEPVAGATSMAFDIENPIPLLSSMDPIWVAAGAEAFTLTVTGLEFVPNSIVRFGGLERATTFASASELSALIPASDVAAAGTPDVTVFSPAAGGGESDPLTFTVTATAQAPEVWVDDDWTGYDYCDGHVWGYDAFKSIQEGVDGVAAGGIVHVASGMYVEQVGIDRTMQVVGLPGDEAAGPAAGAPVIDGDSSGIVVEITASDVTFAGFTLRNSGATATDAGIRLTSVTGCAVNDNDVTGNANGVVLILASGNAVARNVVSGNGAYGIGIVAGTGNTIEHNAVSGNGLDAIALDNATAIGGSVAAGSTGNVIKGNSLSSVRDGIFLGENCDGNQVKAGNQIVAASVGISFWRSGGHTVTDNAINSAVAGIRLLGSSGNVVTGNAITGNATGIDVDASWQVGVWYPSEDNVIRDNNLSGNSTAAIACGVQQSAIVDASGNWWGSADAATVKAQVSGLVDYTPWLAIGTDTDGDAVGFKGDFSSLWVDDDSPQTGSAGRIQEGVDRVLADGAVNVSAGIYAEPGQIVVDKDCAIVGAGAAEAVLKTDRDTGNVGDAKAWLITLPDVAFNLSGVTLDGTGHKVYMAVRHQGSGVIADCVFTNIQYDAGGGAGHAYQGTAIGVHSSGNVDVMGCTFEAIGRIGVVAYDEYWPLPAVGPTGTFANNTYIGKGLGDWLDYAFQVQGGASILVTNNVVSGCQGIAYDGSGSSAIAVWDDPGTASTIVGNTLVGNGAGIAVALWYGDSTDPVVTIADNHIVGNLGGIEVSGFGTLGTPTITMVGSTITNNTIGLYMGEDVSVANMVLQGNDLSANTEYAVALFGSGTLAAERNWWGSLTGPANGTNPGGTGAPVSGDVDFSPWLADGTDTQPDVIGFQPNVTPVYYLPTALEFSVQPGDATLGAALSPQPQVAVRDAMGNVATQFNGVVTMAIGNNPGQPNGGVLNGTLQITVIHGVALFDGLNMTLGTGEAYTLSATTEGLDAVVSAPFTIINRQPQLVAVGAKSVNEEELLSFPLSASDPDGAAQVLTYTMTDGPVGATLDPASGQFDWTPTEAQQGDYDVTFTVTDNGAPVQSVSETVTITVNEVNDAPVLDSIGPQGVNEQATLSFTVSASDPDDVPANNLTLSATDLPLGATFDPATGAFAWTPTEDQQGSYDVTFTVTDEGTPPLEHSETVTITVAEVNEAPVLDAIGPKGVNNGSLMSFTVSASDPADTPPNALMLSVEGLPEGAAFDSGTGEFTWTPTAAQLGSYDLTFRVTDDGVEPLDDSETVRITVIGAAQVCAGYWSPDDAMVVSNTFAVASGSTIESLSWTPELPTGWTLSGASGDAAPIVVGDTVVFAGPFESSIISFRYAVTVPGGQAVSNAITATATFKVDSMAAAQTVVATPEPLSIYRYHSADYTAPYRVIDGSEINRVLSYWRAGYYARNVAGRDGYMATATLDPETVANYPHSADYEADGQISLVELATVQAFWTSGGYSVDMSAPSGYVPSLSGVGPDSDGPVTLSMSVLSENPTISTTSVLGTTYDPGQRVNLTCVFTPDCGIWSLGFAVDLPEGWKIESALSQTPGTVAVVNDAGTEVSLIGALSAEQVVVLTVSVPLTENRQVSFGNTVVYYAEGDSAVQSLTAEPVTLSPADADSNGIADSWEDHYATEGVRMAADVDSDGDGHTTSEEYLTGTVPTDRESVLRMIAIVPRTDGSLAISWQSVAGRHYTVQRSLGGPGSVDFEAIAVDLPADMSGTNVYVEPPGVGGRAFYRVVVEEQE